MSLEVLRFTLVSAAARVLNVPKFRRRLVFGSSFLEYNRYSPVLSFRIIFLQSASLGKSCIRDAAR